jgi:hypothetical protein
MPYTKTINGKSVRDYRRQYDEYDGKPSVVADRAKRNAARAKLKAAGVDVRGKDVAHKKALSKGGSNDMSNLTVQAPSKNKSFKRKSNGEMK